MTEAERRKRVIEQARFCYADDDIKIDDDAKLSEAGIGVWVQAWVWVDLSGTEEEVGM